MRLKLASTICVALAVCACVIAKDKAKPQIDTSKLVWPAPPAQPKLKWIGEIRNEFDVGAKKKKTFVDRLAGKAESILWLNRPLSVAYDPEGVLFVGDTEQGIFMFDSINKKVQNFSVTSGRFLASPVGVAADSSLVFASDSKSNSLNVYDKKGNFISAIGEANGVNHPVGLAVDEGRDLLVVVNAGNHEVLLFTRQLKLLRKLGKRGTGPGEFNFPTYACIIKDKGFAVVDTGNFRVQIFDFNGKFLGKFGEAGDVTGMFSRPKGIACDADGNLYVADANFHNLQVFRQDGQVLTFIGKLGKNPGNFSLPTGMAMSRDGVLAVADQFNHRIQLIQYLGGKGGEAGNGKEVKSQGIQ